METPSNPSLSARLVLSVRWLSVSVVVLCSVIFSITSLHWLLVGDASLMHYVVFLMQRGLAPYRDIVDVNLPGTYLVEWMVMHLFGAGSLAWRLFDLSLALGIALMMALIAWPKDRLAGLIAGGIFFLIHGRDGMNELGQRDLVMTFVLMGMVWLSLSFLRTPRYSCLAAAGLLAGFATTIKPTASVFWLAVLIYIVFFKSDSIRAKTCAISSALPAFLIAPCLATFYLFQRGSLHAFWQILTGLIPLHNRLLRVPDTYFLGHLFPSTLLPILLIWAILIVMCYRSGIKLFDHTDIILLLAVVCGLFSFYIQRKALPYHRYPADAFFLLSSCLIFCKALRRENAPRAIRIVAAAGLIVGALIITPQCLSKTFKLSASPTDFSGLLQRDLTALGGSTLDRRVQCIDFTAGCVTTLYRMRLQQSTGYLYDCYLFQPGADAEVEKYRESFWTNFVSNEPDVVVVSDHDCGHPNSFDKLQRWQQFSNLLKQDYQTYKEVTPPEELRWASRAVAPYRYRIYTKRGAVLPAREQLAPDRERPAA